MSNKESSLSKLSMRLFGLPYQFPKTVDPRVDDISTTIGKKFTENIILESPVCTIIPGKPKYLPNSDVIKKTSTTTALLEAASGDFSSLQQIISDNTIDDMRLYDFERDYTTYMKYVNVLCRACASFLEIDQKIVADSKSYSFQRYDWKNYRWNSTSYMNLTEKTSKFFTACNKSKGKNNGGSSTSEKFLMDTDESDEELSMSEVLANYNYVQFYIDPDVSPSESMSNETGESQMKSLFESGQSAMKEISFMANSGGMDAAAVQQFANDSFESLSSGVQQILGGNSTILGTAGGALSRIINLSGDVVKGNNIIIPDIYQNSRYSKGYSITVHLKSPYGTKFGYFMDICVPLMHLLALTLPKQESANSYSSPFLIKAYVDGIFTCNLGIVTDMSIQRVSDSYSVAGLPSEVDVTLNIADLYSDLSISSASSPINFINNSSLIEYLATTCGMSLTSPNFKAKYMNIVNTLIASFTDIPTNLMSSIDEKIANLISDATGLYK